MQNENENVRRGYQVGDCVRTGTSRPLVSRVGCFIGNSDIALSGIVLGLDRASIDLVRSSAVVAEAFLETSSLLCGSDLAVLTKKVSEILLPGWFGRRSIVRVRGRRLGAWSVRLLLYGGLFGGDYSCVAS